MLDNFRERSKSRKQANKKFLGSLKQMPWRKVDEAFHQLHEEVFTEIDCLACANCCKTTSPIFYGIDIERIARALNLKPGAVIEKYLRLDEDGDYVLQKAPCPFLANDNRCTVYTHRPKACREYPHTNRKKMFQVLSLTFKNTLVCPAVLEIVERIRKKLA